MKKLCKRIVVVLLAFSMFLSTGVFNNLKVAFASESSSYSIDVDAKGTTFSKQSYFQTKNGLSALPHTFEAVIKMPAGFGTARAGCIFSNYHHKDDAAISFELNSGGHPRLYIKNDTETGVTDITFSTVVVTDDTLQSFIDGYFHVAITLDDSTNTAKCYVNGILKETKTYSNDYADLGVTLANLPFGEEDGAFRIGNDYRHDNAQYFKGLIKSVAVYSGVKTSFDRNLIALTSDLVCAYDLSDVANLGDDLSSNNNDCIFRGYTTFALDDFYTVDKKLEEMPRTFETWVKMPSVLPNLEHPKAGEDEIARGGVIIGNYKYGGETSINLEVTNKGEPRLFFVDSTTSLMKNPITKSIVFSSASSNLLNDEWTHLAVTFDNTVGEVKCYINGVLTETKTGYTTDYHANSNFSRYLIGNDYRAMYSFRGAIRNVAMYSDVRTATEISADMTAKTLSDENLIASIKASKMGKTFVDESGNGYDASYSTVWLEEKEPVTDYAYTIAVVGDTQIASMYDVRNGTTIMKDTYKWIADNVESKKIVQVLGLGDITETSMSPVVDDERAKEWANAKASITQLDGKVAYSLSRGNHDVIVDFEANFGSHTPYTSQFDGFYEGSILNSYRLFTAGEEDYVLITLDYGASDAMLEWAGSVCEAYPDRKVIVTTHAYLYRDGTTISTGDVCEPSADTDRNTWLSTVPDNRDYNTGEEMWQGFLKKYSNIFMVLSGHDPSIEVICSKAIGDNGNTVTQLLVDPQGIDYKEPLQGDVDGPFGMVTLLYFSADGQQIDVETYSTIYDAYHMASNQFTIDLSCTNHVFDQQVQDEKYIKEEATCQHGTIYYKSCKCGEFSTTAETFSDNILAEHVFDKEVADSKYFVSDADCEHGAKYKKSCACGLAGTEEFEYGKGEHDYVLHSTVSPNWSAQEDGYEVWVCSRDSSHVLNKTIEWETLSSTIIVTNGSVNGNTVAVVEIGSSVTVLADTIDGKHFVNWMVNGNVVSTDSEYTFTTDSSVVVITANFEDGAPSVEPENPETPETPENPETPDTGNPDGSGDNGGSQGFSCQMAVNAMDGGLMPICFATLLATLVVLLKRKFSSKKR